MALECVIDTGIIQKTNATITTDPAAASHFLKRVRLLSRVHAGQIKPLVSKRLLAEYAKQVEKPRNETVRLFFETLDKPDGAIWNWRTPWSRGQAAQARRCRFPKEDVHLLRTALRDHGGLILSEEARVLACDKALHLHFGVHTSLPWND